MLKFDEQKQRNSVNGALALRPEIEKVIDSTQKQGFDHIFFLGIGGTWASGMQVEVYMRGKSSLSVLVENAAEFITTGNKRLTKDSLVIFSSVTGSTEEMVKAIEKVRKIGARVFGFVDKPDSPMVEQCNWCISYPMNEQLKFFMVANRLMYNNGEFPEYERYNQEMETHLADVLIEVEKEVDDFARKYAKKKYKAYKKHPEMPHYFVAAGSTWGSTYSYAMCYWEEQLWIRTKSITSGEFFHGMLEIVDAETPVTLFISEDEQRPLSERVKAFLPKVCRNYTIIDTKDYELKGISTEFRGSISHLVIRAVNNRVDAYMEKEFCHPMMIRRYYRQFSY